MNTFSEQLSIALVGILVVFIGLIIIIFFIKILGLLSLERKTKKEVEKTTEVETKQDAAKAPQEIVQEGINPEIIAAISAALCLYYDGNEKFIVRKIKRTKRINN